MSGDAPMWLWWASALLMGPTLAFAAIQGPGVVRRARSMPWQLSGPRDTPAVVGKDVTTLSDVDLCAQEGHLLHLGGNVCLRCDQRVT